MKKVIIILGSTSAVAAFVFDLEECLKYTAVSDDNRMTVSEVVTETQLIMNKTKGNVHTSEVKDIQLTLIVIPWYIDVIAESEVKVVLRFLNFSMIGNVLRLYRNI